MLKMNSNKFPQELRLKRQADFDTVFADGRRFKVGSMMIRIAANEIGTARLGISIGTRFGSAVERNGMKRKIREAFRKVRRVLPACDIVCVPHPAARELSVLEIMDVLKKVCIKFDSHAKPDSKN
jgi:ribonuclease P protein component